MASKRERVMHRLAVALASILLLFGSAACGGGSGESASSEASDSFDADAPEAEDPDAEEAPDETDPDAVAVELPGLPIGGNTEVVSDTLQCVDVGWTEPPDLPSWIGITVTGVTFTPADAFAASPETCAGGAPPCLSAGFQLTGDERCFVAVAFTGGQSVEGSMSFSSGVINCPPDRVEQCESFRDEVESEGAQSIDLEAAPLGGTSEGETGEGETGEGETGEGETGEGETGEGETGEGETDPGTSPDSTGDGG
jgi:hypothetical protein